LIGFVTSGAAAREEELGRRGDDRPRLPAERSRNERPQRRERRGERARVALERRGEVLHEVHLVDVAARDRPSHASIASA
jgi:hypothetical protein